MLPSAVQGQAELNFLGTATGSMQPCPKLISRDTLTQGAAKPNKQMAAHWMQQ